ncbi:MAG: hypothetical protein J5J06_03635 [Phycisphaerae bacterium]|nr:hypothetical protein [Phycisphaerae bacterium]
MNSRLRSSFALIGLLAATFAAAGCQTSSVRTHRSYEYNGSSPPPRERAEQPSEREELESDWEMKSPGEMVVEPE